MNLTDIQHALEEILRLNPSITKERLTTLLVASGWEKRNVSEAILIYETITPDLPAPHVVPEDHLLREATVAPSYDGLETNMSHKDAFSLPYDNAKDTPLIQEEVLSRAPEMLTDKDEQAEEKKEAQEQEETIHEESAQQEVKKKEKDSSESFFSQFFAHKNSLKEEEPSPAKQPKEEPVIPENLPLKPFQTSEHIWSFARYRDMFHRWGNHDEVEEKAKEDAPTFARPTYAQQAQNTPPVHMEKASPYAFETTAPIVVRESLSQKDKSLVITASLLLLVILLMLGYMYSQGRL